MAVSQELADQLRSHVDQFGEGKRVTAIHLFGIEHGERLTHLSTGDCKALALRAGFKEWPGTELHKGIRLAPYAQRKR